MSEVFIGRQPVLDRYMNVFAYDLQFYQGSTPSCESSLHATQSLIAKIQEAIGFQSIVGSHVAMVHLPSQMIRKEFLPHFDGLHPMMLEISSAVLGNAQLLRSLKELKQLGSSIVLGGFTDLNTHAKLASISDYIKIEVGEKNGIELKPIVEALHQQGIKVIAQKVDTEAQFQVLKTLGFDYFQGYFLNNPTIINGKKMSGNRLILLQLLAKVNEPSTRFQELSDLIAQDVTLSYKLLEAINKPAAMVPIRVETLSDALKYLGLNRLKFWVNTLMLSNMEGVPKELLTSSLARAKFCERLASDTKYIKEKESFFLVGLFSNLGAFFKVPLEDVVMEMPLSNEIKAALVQHYGAMGKALLIVEEVEKIDASSHRLKFEQLGISELSERFMLANAWAQQAIL